MWHESFGADGGLLGSGDERCAESLARATRAPLLALLDLLERGCGWPRERVFFFVDNEVRGWQMVAGVVPAVFVPRRLDLSTSTKIR